MKAEARRLWEQEDTRAFAEIERTLQAMAPGHERCMYCESSEGSGIEHFWPRSTYPCLTYVWENHLWACSVCNSNHKRDAFPLDEQGAPLLINPTEEDPLAHLDLDPHTGKYVGKTRKGEESIRVYGLGRGPLVKMRRQAWDSIQIHIVAYAQDHQQGQLERADRTREALCAYPHASVLLYLLVVVGSPAGRALVRSDCIAALEAHPEIRTWLVIPSPA
jgi:uncharacterized protein (TIGR02646 family)